MSTPRDEAISSVAGWGAASLAISNEVENPVKSTPGHPIEAVRTVPGFGPNRLQSIAGDDCLAASVATCFFHLGRTTVPGRFVGRHLNPSSEYPSATLNGSA